MAEPIYEYLCLYTHQYHSSASNLMYKYFCDQYSQYDVFCFYLWLTWLLEKWAYIYFMPLKRTIIVRVIYWHLLLELFRGISSLGITVLKLSIIITRIMVSLYSMFVAEDEKTKCILNPFSWSNYNDCYAFIRECVTNHVTLFESVSTIEVIWLW